MFSSQAHIEDPGAAPLHAAYIALRFGLGAGALLAGADKFLNLLTTWEMYLSPLAQQVSPVGGAALMQIVGCIEIAAGAALLAGLTRIGGYVVAAWLALIAVNLVTTGMFYDLAVRDLEIAIAAFTLARLTEARSVQADVRHVRPAA